jgi:hypothetical protein
MVITIELINVVIVEPVHIITNGTPIIIAMESIFNITNVFTVVAIEVMILTTAIIKT